MEDLKGKVGIVTGASHSIGRAIALALANEGMNLVLASRSTDLLNQVAATCAESGVRAEVVTTDVTSDKQIEALFARTMQVFGRLDLLVSNAGIFADNIPIDKVSTEMWDKVVATDLRSHFLCAREAMRIMKKQGGGRIINIGSVSAQRPRMDNAPYTVCKFGLVGLTQSAALEGRAFNINCGIIHPGVTRRDSMPNPKDTVMEASDIAAGVVYMARQPANVNVLEMIQLPTTQAYLGRG